MFVIPILIYVGCCHSVFDARALEFFFGKMSRSNIKFSVNYLQSAVPWALGIVVIPALLFLEYYLFVHGASAAEFLYAAIIFLLFSIFFNWLLMVSIWANNIFKINVVLSTSLFALLLDKAAAVYLNTFPVPLSPPRFSLA